MNELLLLEGGAEVSRREVRVNASMWAGEWGKKDEKGSL